MNRGQLRLEVRRAIGELTADFWSDAELNDWLNEAAKVMVSNAQSLQSVEQRNTVAGQQEYVLPKDVDEVFSVKLMNGGVDDLQAVQATHVQVGSSFTGTPQFFYIRSASHQTGEMSDDGIDVSDVSDDGEARVILGLYPVPSSAFQLTAFYYSRHAHMETDGAVPSVPPEFRRGLVAYATALAKEKECAYAEADRKTKEFQGFSDRLREKMITEGQHTFPTVQCGDERVPYGDVIIRFGTAT